MKKIVLLLIAGAIAFSVSAQNKFGIRGGLNMANVDIEASGLSVSPESRTTFFAGINFEVPMKENLFISPGIQYTGRGYKLSGNGNSGEAKLSYIDIPLLLNFKAPVSETANILISGGGIAGILLSATGESKYSNGTSNSEDIKDSFETFNFGLIFGGGIEIVSTSVTIIPQVYYTIGLTNLEKNTSGSSEVSVTARDLSFGVGFRF